MKVLDDASYVKDDPVRPSLSYAFRKSVEKCSTLVRTHPMQSSALHIQERFPKNYKNLRFTLTQKGDIGVAYTVWSYSVNAEREIINELCDYAWDNNFKRLITLSPKTEIDPRKFHLKNGAFVLSENKESDNYEYIL